MKDWVDHLSTLFPPVRPRGYLELRCLDALPDRWWPAVAALVTTLVDDPVAADEAAEACAPVADAWHTAVRLAFDQTAENATGAGAPPATWPARELLVDVLHKTVFCVVTGRLADRALPPALASTHGRTSH